MALRKPKGGKKLIQLSKRKKPLSKQKPLSRQQAQRYIIDARRKAASPQKAQRRSRAVLADEVKRAPLRKLSQLRRESGAAVSVQELRDFLRRKPKGK